MIDFQDMVSFSEIAHPMLGLLFDIALKGALLLVFAGVVTTFFRRMSSSLRHLVWGLAFCSVLLLPVLSFLLPSWQVPVLPAVAFLSEHSEAAPVSDFSLSSVPLPEVQEESAALLPRPGSDAVEASGTSGPAPVSPPGVVHGNTLEDLVADTPMSWQDRLAAWPWFVWAFWIWSAGLVATLLRFVIGSVGIWWLSRRARPVLDRTWHKVNREVADHLLLTRKVRLLQSPRTAMPMTWGFYHPIVLLPVTAHTWSSERRRCVLMHEFAHIKRWDCLIQALVQMVCAFNWFNPLVWYAARQMRIEREKACDDVVLAGGTKASEYASHLLDIARSTRASFVIPFGAVAIAGRSQLERRVMSILDGRCRRYQTDSVTRMLGLVMTAFLIIPLAVVHPVVSRQDVPADPDQIDLETHFVPVDLRERGKAIHHVIEGQTTWSAKVAAGQTIEIKGIWGNIDARPASGDKVEVSMMSALEGVQEVVKIIHHAQGITFCIAYAELGQDCGEADPPRAYAARPAEIDFLVHLPKGVHLVARTAQGNIQATGLFSNVQATTIEGDIVVQSYGRVWAESVAGDVGIWTNTFGGGRTLEGNFFAKMGQTRWHGTLPISSVKGDITISLPPQADADVELKMESSGQLISAISLTGGSGSAGGRYQGRLGVGGRVLALHSVEGNISIIGADQRTFHPYRSIEVDAPEGDRPDREDRRSARSSTRYTAPPLLATAFDDQDKATRVALLKQFVEDNGPGMVAALGEVLVQDPHLEIRKAAARALGKVGCRDGIPSLLRGLDDGSAEVRKEVARVLHKTADPRAIQPLAHQLRWETDLFTRQEIVQTLEEMAPDHPVLHHTQLFPVLEVATTGQHVKIRHGAIKFSFTTDLVEMLNTTFSGFELDRHMAEADVHAAIEMVHAEGESAYEQAMRALHLGPLSRDDLVLARLVGVDPNYVQGVRTEGYCPTLDEFVQLKVAGIDEDFLRETAGTGYQDLPVDALIALRLDDLTGDETVERGPVGISAKESSIDEEDALGRFGLDP